MSENAPVRQRAPILCWVARLFGIAAIAFLSLFALDVFQSGMPLGPALVGFLIHLIPNFVLIGILVVAWRWPLAGGLLFLVFTVPFLFLSNAAWVNAILAAPFAVTGLLFLACFFAVRRRRRRTRTVFH